VYPNPDKEISRLIAKIQHAKRIARLKESVRSTGLLRYYLAQKNQEQQLER
jgi:hypothetical protein